MKKILSIIIALCSITLVSCDKETEGISKLTAFPEFKMEGAAFMNVKLDPAGTFTDPGVKAFVGDEEYPVKVTGTVNIREKGLYTLNYETVSKEGFPVTTSRMVLVTPELVQNDYSGTYTLVHATKRSRSLLIWLPVSWDITKQVTAGGKQLPFLCISWIWGEQNCWFLPIVARMVLFQ